MLSHKKHLKDQGSILIYMIFLEEIEDGLPFAVLRRSKWGRLPKEAQE